MELLVPLVLLILVALLSQVAGADSRDLDPRHRNA